MKDKWCQKITLSDGRTVSGAAARNVLISKYGGMDKILHDVAINAATEALNKAGEILNPPSTKLRLVK
ncbi:hypothetical protein [Neisseria shayeganii]|uniref:Uncharacterized protein n=1 Tax=Neisseria shayeganii TaxID=607712 RepID=A0A7D7SQL5_9NEIS|nr:hypothetical protein [Neisseria shayeganii]QMT41150.1 hypothetical protein H3L94_03710 [Neisseria shayeganii]